MSLPLIRASIFLRSTRIGQVLTKVGTQKRQWGGMEMFLDKQVPARSPLMKRTYQNFESNLRDTIAAARSSGAQVIVATIATNLKDCAPFASLHREDLGPEALRSWSALVGEGTALEDSRSYAEALKAYLSATAIDDQYAELEFRIARCLWRLGEYGSARDHFLRARDLDTLRFRADSRINDINRSVASSAGVELLDADAILAKESPNGITGSELIYEHVHLKPEGNYLMARALFFLIAGKLAAETGQLRPEVLSQVECEQLLAFTSHDRARIEREMLERLQKPPFTNQLNHSDQVLRLTIVAGSPEESANHTSAEYQWAIRKKPEDRILHYNFGLFLLDYDRRAAVEQLRLSRPWDGFPVFAPDGTPIE